MDPQKLKDCYFGWCVSRELVHEQCALHSEIGEEDSVVAFLSWEAVSLSCGGGGIVQRDLASLNYVGEGVQVKEKGFARSCWEGAVRHWVGAGWNCASEAANEVGAEQRCPRGGAASNCLY